jgi:hypothetical protein
MTMGIFESSIRDMATAQEQLRAVRDQTAENGARLAWHYASFTTTGQGYTAVNTPVMFDCIFAEAPALMMGLTMNSPAKDATLRYPMCNVGVWKWVTEKNPSAKTKEKTAKANYDLMVASGAAKLLVSSAKADLNTAKTSEDDLLWKGAYPYFNVDVPPIIRDAAGDGDASKVRMTFHLIWMGLAYKDISSTVMDGLHSDPAATPRVPGGSDDRGVGGVLAADSGGG